MSIDHVIDLVQRMAALALLVAAPVLGAGLLVGLIISVFQAATQIQENALGFVPKLLAMGATLVFAGPWLLRELVTFLASVITELAFVGRYGGFG